MLLPQHLDRAAWCKNQVRVKNEDDVTVWQFNRPIDKPL
jgi:hypothetical protein